MSGSSVATYFLFLGLFSMLNVLITGSRGFLGSTLRKVLFEDSDVRVLEFCRADSDEILHEYTKIADFIFHFAGEVRPTSSDEDFVSSNSQLTAKLASFLCRENKKTPVLLASSIHAIEPKNMYGQTKLESELIVEKYAEEQGATALIYRLPHVFGPGCKENYNSVISTWIYNSHHNLDINVFNRDIQMHYCYSYDLITSFINHLKNSIQTGCFYITPEKTYNTTLGEVVDLIGNFKLKGKSATTNYLEGSFEEKLYLTYQSYAVKQR